MEEVLPPAARDDLGHDDGHELAGCDHSQILNILDERPEDGAVRRAKDLERDTDVPLVPCLLKRSRFALIDFDISGDDFVRDRRRVHERTGYSLGDPVYRHDHRMVQGHDGAQPVEMDLTRELLVMPVNLRRMTMITGMMRATIQPPLV